MDEPSLTPQTPIKGRGAAYNPANRFDLLYSETDPEWDPADNRPPVTEIYKDTTKQIISYSDSPDLGPMASINPYRGCEHGCVYCYARPGHEYFGLSCGVDFESKIFAKETAAELLKKELMRRNWTPRTVVMSGVTDPYQPVECRLKISRQCLKVLLSFRNPVVIITKNRLVTRDIDVLSELNAFGCTYVNVSITSLDKGLARVMEPRASSPAERLKTVEELAAKNILVNVMVAPVIPGLTDHEIPSILKAVADAGAVSAGYVMLRLPYANKDLFVRWLKNHFPERADRVLNRLRSVRGGKLYDATFGARMRGKGVFAEYIHTTFDVYCRKHGLNKKRISLTTEFFENPFRQKQFELF